MPQPLLSLLVSVVFLTVSTPLPALAADGALWGVHLASYRTPSTVQSGWDQLRKTHADILGELEHSVSEVDLPGKGHFLRLLAGPLGSWEQAQALQQALQSRGVWAELAPCPVATPTAASVAPPTTIPAPSPVAVVPQPVAPPQPQAPAPPALVATRPTSATPTPALNLERPAPSAPKARPQADTAAERLRKYVPAPEVKAARTEPAGAHVPAMNASDAGLQPGTPPAGIGQGLSGGAAGAGGQHHVGFNNEDEYQDGLTLARSPRSKGRISAQYGNLEDLKPRSEVAPLRGGEPGTGFKPFVGLGFHF